MQGVSAAGLPYVVTLSFDTNGRTMMGVTPVRALETLGQFGVAALGGNCGNGPHEIETVIEKMRAANGHMALIAKSNAGLPHLESGTPIYDATPEVMADYAIKVRNLGARIIGGCCGSTPEHIRAMAQALGKTEPA